LTQIRADSPRRIQRARLARAISRSSPAGWPIGQIMPKLRIDAPAARSERSKIVTR
jgi:hypothetical protein